ncbi:hypothetical protein K470DRAFT_111714 [Piedraia hortae CBS 480.64]|uniref:Uncharacterized protein n=1 Tax=Piedraia hortae CBS 480.64 TaxID=1314780 RepID=A0A6A7BX51_9PEZI|nr:hypothetical protein K470DRAFT_111714 [Piedraia hortae CBS 480.64]
MSVGDNPQVSEFCSHLWNSVFPCRVCSFKITHLLTIDNLIHAPSLRKVLRTKTGTKNRALGIESPPTSFYKLGGSDPHRDFPFEILLCVLLGYVKYLWQRTMKAKGIRKDLYALALCAGAINRDELDRFPTAKPIVSWGITFTGPDFRNLDQILPSTLVAFYSIQGMTKCMGKLIRIWCTLASLTRMLYDSSIEDMTHGRLRFFPIAKS